jgi:hypothetical protein
LLHLPHIQAGIVFQEYPIIIGAMDLDDVFASQYFQLLA